MIQQAALAGDTVPSFCPANNIVGTRVALIDVEKIAGANPIAAFNDGRFTAAHIAPPPPIE